MRTLVFVLALLMTAAWGCDSKKPESGAAGTTETAETAEAPDEEAARDHGPEEGVWCHGHGIPESMCTKCHPELVAKFKEKGDWCEEHKFPESGCPVCNPMTPPGEGGADEHEGHDHAEHKADGPDWCAGHAIPESMCTRCNPELVQKFKDKGDWCAEHGFPESACPKCNPMEPPADLPEQGAVPQMEKPFELGTIIKLKKEDHEKIAGIKTEMAANDSTGLSISAPARIEFDPNLVAEVRAPFAGIVREVLVDLGEPVEKGDALFVLESAEIGNLQARIRSAKQRVETARLNFERQQRLKAQGVAPTRQVEEARQSFEEAQASYSALQGSLRLAGAGAGNGRFSVEAPLTGVVVRRPAVVGSSAEPSTPLARIADSSKLWAVIDVSEEEAAVVQPGQAVELVVEAMRAGTPRGSVSWVSPEIDERTRTVRVRAEIDNADGKLRANQFAQANIQVSLDDESVVVPRDALQRVDDKHVLFVRNGPGVYEPREADVVRRIGDRVQIAKGVWPGEQVVTTGAYLLRTELMRDAIGAGCCEVPE